jgi:hypothetical protein
VPSSFCSVCSGLALSDEGGNSEGRLENVGLGRPLLLLSSLLLLLIMSRLQI